MSHDVVFLVVNHLRREVAIRFVDKGGIVDHHCLSFLSVRRKMSDHAYVC